MRTTGATVILDRVTYAYRRWSKPVLADFSYQLPEGLTVLLGPNGAGKSTLLKLAAGVLRPGEGTVTLDGTPSTARAYRRDVGWLPQNVQPMPQLTAREYVAYVGWLKGMSPAEADRQAPAALARVNLTEQTATKTQRLSGGQLRRLGIAATLVHSSRVLLLDEPSAGLDPTQRRDLRTVLTSLSKDVRILMSTHDTGDIAEEADHVHVLTEGTVTFDGDTSEFLALAPPDVAAGRRAEAAYTVVTHGADH
ncbi:ATP-binding cassette domain-containing protein [Streptomyces sp. NPDC058308]|uniref:ATP-binding cassette domain-containing protein n=1 Tax=Streptomyces sp. NPDC058308 TaxID=3346440 RepID=UPI0036E3B31E